MGIWIWITFILIRTVEAGFTISPSDRYRIADEKQYSAKVTSFLDSVCSRESSWMQLNKKSREFKVFLKDESDEKSLLIFVWKEYNYLKEINLNFLFYE